ncbi:hypothetical protein GCM10007140_21600 [Priestia taiwanensis]|uniref:Uncharacterized protein n=1 Tax=Priestia taiwanensis TaxID=1347902 RepID=A0A917AUR2_9BACI|nr:hypothetical protein GCM10007140_21600 [Priestia taiwanensis]
MHWRKYLSLGVPCFFLGLAIILYAPQEKKTFSYLITLLFWATYYLWIHVEKKKRTK